jgi:hypothetical protein
MNGKQQILYLSHKTNMDNIENILESGFLYTSFERKLFNVKYTGIITKYQKSN